MTNYELEILLNSLEYSTKQDWEQTRLSSYIIAQTQSTKHLSPYDIVKFPWDNKLDEDDKLTKDDVGRLTKKMNLIVEQNKQKENGRLSNETTVR